jgi:hypothetical protein
MYCVIANVIQDKILRTGAKIYVLYCNGDAEHPKVRGLAKGGRPITKHIPYKRLTNFRAAFVPPKMQLQGDVMWQWEEKEDAERLANALNDMWENIRFFDNKGNLIKDGLPASAAFKRK